MMLKFRITRFFVLIQVWFRYGRSLYATLRKAGSSIGGVVEVRAEGIPLGLGVPVYGKLDADLAFKGQILGDKKGVIGYTE
ncbi:Chorismate synthase [Entomobacter blattae]|uniref:chorismate synthase n=2 Tax=Entomobacter blattae TaxID=2762277 RepID=A0A7H1NQI9_9PROT|nr:Chorismate synthase [Entomobacter blattae]